MDEATNWRRSSFCSTSGCAEIKIEQDVVLLRSSHRPDKTIELTKTEWDALKRGIVGGEF